MHICGIINDAFNKATNGQTDIKHENCDIAANPPGFSGNLLDFETCPGIPDLNFFSPILKFVEKKRKKKKRGSFLGLCQGLR